MFFSCPAVRRRSLFGFGAISIALALVLTNPAYAEVPAGSKIVVTVPTNGQCDVSNVVTHSFNSDVVSMDGTNLVFTRDVTTPIATNDNIQFTVNVDTTTSGCAMQDTATMTIDGERVEPYERNISSGGATFTITARAPESSDGPGNDNPPVELGTPHVTPPTCETPGVVESVPHNSEGVTYIYSSGDGHVSAILDADFEFGALPQGWTQEDDSTAIWPLDLDQLTGDQCENDSPDNGENSGNGGNGDGDGDDGGDNGNGGTGDGGDGGNSGHPAGNSQNSVNEHDAGGINADTVTRAHDVAPAAVATPRIDSVRHSVTGHSGAYTASELPATGGASAWILAAGNLLVAAGAVTMFVMRRVSRSVRSARLAQP